jgi:hypothetical protein
VSYYLPFFPEVAAVPGGLAGRNEQRRRPRHASSSGLARLIKTPSPTAQAPGRDRTADLPLTRRPADRPKWTAQLRPMGKRGPDFRPQWLLTRRNTSVAHPYAAPTHPVLRVDVTRLVAIAVVARAAGAVISTVGPPRLGYAWWKSNRSGAHPHCLYLDASTQGEDDRNRHHSLA